MFRKANQNDNTANANTQPENILTATDISHYQQQLAAINAENSARQVWLKRELERQQGLIAAAIGMEKAAKEKLNTEQEELNRLEEESRAAILLLAEAKQKSDSLNEEYNLLLERVKDLRTLADKRTEELNAQQLQVKQLVEELQQQTFFGNRQIQVLQAINDGHYNDEHYDALPPLDDLLPPKAEPINPAKSEKNHANADFWEKGSHHTALKLQEHHHTEPNIADKTPDEALASKPDTDSQNARPDNAAKPGKLRILFSYIICILLAVAVALAIRTWVLMPTEVSGSSMSPTLQSADKLLTTPLPYLWGEPQRGDIIVFQAPNEEDGVYYVKRVIGLAGERVLIEDGSVYINNELLQEPYLVDTVTDGYVNTIVPADSVFVLGDNRIVSHDSRADDVACIDYDEIYGKAVWRIAPFDDFGSIY